MAETPPFKDYIFAKFLEWEKLQPGQRSTYTTFALWLSDNSLGITLKQQLVNDWIRGKYKPSEDKYLLVLEEKFGNEIYKVLDVKRPDRLLQQINARWDRIPPDKQQKLVELSEQFETKNEEQRIQGTSKSRKKVSIK
jgi:hypothetical protein